MNKQSLWHKLLIIGGLAILGLLSALVGLRLVIKGGEVTVPTLEGQNIVTVLEELNRLNLRLEIEDQAFHPKIPVNHVISQRPEANSQIKTGRKVKVVLSRGAKVVKVPQLTGKSWFDAQTVLRKQGLAVGLLSQVHINEPPQKILGQSPTAGASIQLGEKVNLLISQGPAPDFYLMPDFIGQQLSVVRRKLKIMNLSLGEITYETYKGLDPDIIIKQVPAAGFRIQQGKLVDLTVSQGNVS